MSITTSLTGGAGGNGDTGATAANGAAVSLGSAASASTTGTVTFQQTANGGAGGSAINDTSVAGSGGSANSSISLIQNGVAGLSAEVDASGGSGTPLTASKARAARNRRGSARRGPTICKPMGRPDAVRPHGTTIAGCWLRLKG